MKTLSLILAFGLFTSVYAEDTVSSLNRKLKASGADWFARDSEISQMPLAEFMRMTAAPQDERPEADFITEDQGIFVSLPSTLDWRSRGGSNWVTPILYQGQCGSCVAFAAIATMETQYRIDAGMPHLGIRLSPQHLFTCGGGSCSWGWNGDGAARFLMSNGVPDEACFPYTSGRTGSTGSCRSTCRDYRQRSVRLATYSKPTRGGLSIAAVKRALQHGPVFSMMNLYDDFRYYGGGIYRHTSGAYRSGHAISIIGYNDAKRYFVIRNSWGTGWGENGFARVSYDDTSGVGAWTWSYSTAVHAMIENNDLAGPQVLAQQLVWNPQEGSYSGRININLSLVPAEASLDKLEFHWRGPDGVERVKTAHHVRGEIRLAWNTELVESGEYEIWLTGRSGDHVLEVARKKISVKN